MSLFRARLGKKKKLSIKLLIKLINALFSLETLWLLKELFHT